jgi:hypothetical protein
MRMKLDFTWVRIGVGIFVYVVLLALAAIAIYALVAGPQQFGIDESWPLVFYFVVAYLSTLLVGIGIDTAVRHAPRLMQNML